MKRIALLVALLAAPLVAQTPAPAEITKLVTLRNTEPRAIQGMLQMFGVRTMSNQEMRTMVISGTAEQIAAAEAAIKQLDVAQKNIELTVFFVVGGDSPALAGGPVPQDLRDVIAQLKGTFAFKDYKMLDALTLRTRAGSPADTKGILNGSVPPKMSKFSIRNVTVTEDGTTMRIDHMQAGLQIPVNPRDGSKYEYIDSMITQDVDVKEGQKVVVGRSSLEGPQQALFLVLTAHVIQ